MMKLENYKSSPFEIQETLNPNCRMQVEQNKSYFCKIVRYIRWFCLQEVTFRGEEKHNVGSVNRGNFRELLGLEFELHSELLVQRKSVMEQYSIHTDYLSKEFISIMAF